MFGVVVALIIGFFVGFFLRFYVDLRIIRRCKRICNKKKVSLDTFAKLVTTAVVVHGMIMTTWSYVLACFEKDPVVDVSTTIVREIVAPVIVYLATNTIMNIFEKNQLSFSVPIGSTIISQNRTDHKSMGTEESEENV